VAGVPVRGEIDFKAGIAMGQVGGQRAAPMFELD
jgi:hypothetical protein